MKQPIFPKFNSLKPLWVYYIKENKISLILSVLYLIVTLLFLTNFLQFVEQRNGFVFTDPLLELFNPVDVTWITFVLIYASLVLGIISFIDKPQLIHLAILTYSVMVTFRIAGMYILPLNPPETMILLNDPFVQMFGSGEILTKDLFFSGHTATLFMLYLVSRNKIIKYAFLICTILVAICVLLQHVHYSIDVFAAPFFTFASYKISSSIVRKG
jgi:membrane-associated phospholipid phosphatase